MTDHTPTYTGHAAPGSTVRLYAGPVAWPNVLVPIGSATTSPEGTWTVTTRPLANGRYRVMATAMPPRSATPRLTMVPTAPPRGHDRLHHLVGGDPGRALAHGAVSVPTVFGKPRGGWGRMPRSSCGGRPGASKTPPLPPTVRTGHRSGPMSQGPFFLDAPCPPDLDHRYKLSTHLEVQPPRLVPGSARGVGAGRDAR